MSDVITIGIAGGTGSGKDHHHAAASSTNSAAM